MSVENGNQPDTARDLQIKKLGQDKQYFEDRLRNADMEIFLLRGQIERLSGLVAQHNNTTTQSGNLLLGAEASIAQEKLHFESGLKNANVEIYQLREKIEQLSNANEQLNNKVSIVQVVLSSAYKEIDKLKKELAH